MTLTMPPTPAESRKCTRTTLDAIEAGRARVLPTYAAHINALITKTLTLKSTILSVLCHHRLNLMKVRGFTITGEAGLLRAMLTQGPEVKALAPSVTESKSSLLAQCIPLTEGMATVDLQRHIQIVINVIPRTDGVLRPPPPQDHSALLPVPRPVQYLSMELLAHMADLFILQIQLSCPSCHIGYLSGCPYKISITSCTCIYGYFQTLLYTDYLVDCPCIKLPQLVYIAYFQTLLYTDYLASPI